MADRLIGAGLVAREENPADRREVLMSLTADGAELVGEVTRRRRLEIAHIVEGIPPSRRRAVVSALNAFTEAAGERSPGPDTAARLGW